MVRRPFFDPKCKNFCIWLILLASGIAAASDTVVATRVAGGPDLERFAVLTAGETVPGWGHATGFTQRTPRDGDPSGFRTDVYVGYEATRLHVVFVAFDDAPERVRARMAPRENLSGDDYVTLMLDTFRDERRAYVFRANPYGVQLDATFVEGQGFDTSFDAVWSSEGRRTPHGYVVAMAIPFKSLRFPELEGRSWGVIFDRFVGRGEGETSTWPPVTTRIDGWLNQAGSLDGIADVAPGGNHQFIPYGSFRSFETLDDEHPAGPRFVEDESDADVGLDVKAVWQDRLVADLTVNPDFGQLESDQPQTTVNQRFEVFFPERRPFFLENADFFRTPNTLLFTRRVADPRVGARVTGKLGPWGLGAFLVDDEAPGKRVPAGDPLAGERAIVGALRFGRDVGDQSSVGVLLVDRALEGDDNRVVGIDGRIKWNDRWTSDAQVARSRDDEGAGAIRGDLASLSFNRSGRRVNYFGRLSDIEDTFRADTGFVPRTGFRRATNFASVFLWPEGERVVRWGWEFLTDHVWDRDGRRLDRDLEASVEWQFRGRTFVELNVNESSIRLGPDDSGSLSGLTEFDTSFLNLEYGTAFSDRFSVSGDTTVGRRPNLAPVPGRPPADGDWLRSRANLSLRPLRRLRVDNTVLYARLKDRPDGETIIDDWIVRSRWNWQFDPAWSLRTVVQWEATYVDEARTRLERRENVNVDVLLTYRVNPWTALFIGYNTNRRNVRLVESGGVPAVLRTDELATDGRQFLVKLSWLFR